MYKQENKAKFVRVIISTLLVIFLFANGCANTGPPLSESKLKELEDEIEALATEIYIKDLVSVWKVGFKVLS
ncbi:MAG: hypothetical protein HON76_03280, partial [Candidatus Scalindua sp.]|nr:hypothetical protein [Candidatus Scalindua sp.]